MERDLEQELNELRRTARRIPFFALVRHLARLFPQVAPVGGLGPVSEEAIRFDTTCSRSSTRAT